MNEHERNEALEAHQRLQIEQLTQTLEQRRRAHEQAVHQLEQSRAEAQAAKQGEQHWRAIVDLLTKDRDEGIKQLQELRQRQATALGRERQRVALMTKALETAMTTAKDLWAIIQATEVARREAPHTTSQEETT